MGRALRMLPVLVLVLLAGCSTWSESGVWTEEGLYPAALDAATDSVLVRAMPPRGGLAVAVDGYHDPVGVDSLRIEREDWTVGVTFGEDGIKALFLRTQETPVDRLRPHFDLFVSAVRVQGDPQALWDGLLQRPELRFGQPVPGHYLWAGPPAADPVDAVRDVFAGEREAEALRSVHARNGSWHAHANLPVVELSRPPPPDRAGAWSLTVTADDRARFFLDSSSEVTDAMWSAALAEAYRALGRPVPDAALERRPTFES